MSVPARQRKNTQKKLIRDARAEQETREGTKSLILINQRGGICVPGVLT